jgi:hypothetical protein
VGRSAVGIEEKMLMAENSRKQTSIVQMGPIFSTLQSNVTFLQTVETLKTDTGNRTM